MRLVEAILRLLLGGVFMYAGLLKSLHPSSFARDIENYRLLPHLGVIALSLYLPFLEMICGLAVVMKQIYTGALVLLGLMTTIFACALISAWIRGLNLSCGCFGKSNGQTNFGVDLARDGLLLAAILFLAWQQKRKHAPSTGYLQTRRR